jgi:hypothetical protein
MARTAKEIDIKQNELSNDNVRVQIGMVEQQDSPTTICISMGFWTKPTEPMENAGAILHDKIEACYDAVYTSCLSDNVVFPQPEENIFIVNMPESFAYNEKKNYVKVELYAHTLNVDSTNNVPLVASNDNVIYTTALNVAEAFISSDLLSGQDGFEIKRSNK